MTLPRLLRINNALIIFATRLPKKKAARVVDIFDQSWFTSQQKKKKKKKKKKSAPPLMCDKTEPARLETVPFLCSPHTLKRCICHDGGGRSTTRYLRQIVK